MKAVLVNYCYDPTWLKNYPDLDVTIYDRSDDGVERNLTQYGKVIKTKNVGDVDYDKLGYIIENYDNLPDVFLWGKTNLFKYCSEEEFLPILKTGEYAPILTKNHRTYDDAFGKVCYYEGGLYYERNDSWYLNTLGGKYFHTFTDWAKHFGLPSPAYIPFAPGGSYILTKDRIHKYSRDFYEEMRSFLPYAKRPAEAHCAERSYHLMWK